MGRNGQFIAPAQALTAGFFRSGSGAAAAVAREQIAKGPFPTHFRRSGPRRKIPGVAIPAGRATSAKHPKACCKLFALRADRLLLNPGYPYHRVDEQVGTL
jgi:hypothetical protein